MNVPNPDFNVVNGKLSLTDMGCKHGYSVDDYRNRVELKDSTVEKALDKPKSDAPSREGFLVLLLQELCFIGPSRHPVRAAERLRRRRRTRALESHTSRRE
jgi:hypothetical protein